MQKNIWKTRQRMFSRKVGEYQPLVENTVRWGLVHTIGFIVKPDFFEQDIVVKMLLCCMYLRVCICAWVCPDLSGPELLYFMNGFQNKSAWLMFSMCRNAICKFHSCRSKVKVTRAQQVVPGRLSSYWFHLVEPFTKQWHILTTSRKKSYEKIIGKRENAGNQYFLLFP